MTQFACNTCMCETNMIRQNMKTKGINLEVALEWFSQNDFQLLNCLLTLLFNFFTFI